MECKKEMKIGYKIRDLRVNKKITLKKLAEKTKLTPSFLSQVERDLTSPSISSLEKIAMVLNTKIGNFFETKEHKGFIFIKKALTKNYVDKEKKVHFEILNSDFLNVKMHPQIFTVKSGVELTKELIRFHGEKFGMILKGSIQFFCDEEKLVLEEGDSIYCDYDHELRKAVNIGRSKAKLLWIVLLP